MMLRYVLEMLLLHLQLQALLQLVGYGAVKELGLAKLQVETLLVIIQY